MGHTSEAMAYYEQSRDVYQELGNERRAAEQEVNALNLEVALGSDPADVTRRLTNAIATLRKLGYVDFEVQAMLVQGVSEASSGHLAEARRILHEAASIASERSLKDRIMSLRVAMANVAFLQSDYEGARTILLDAAAHDGSAPDVRIALGRVHLRLGDFDGAKKQLEQAAAQVESTGELTLVPLLHESFGELFLEAGSLDAARKHFQQAVASAVRDVPDDATLEAQCHLGAVPATLASVHKVHVQVECALDEARMEFQAQQYAEVLDTLRQIDRQHAQGATIGPELEAQAHYWRGAALARRGETAAADSERASARKLILQIQAALPEQYRNSFISRSSIRPLIE
jgi:tetratricopeptide (TPR) repeat protein